MDNNILRSDHQARGLRRLLGQDETPKVISVMAPAREPVSREVAARLAQELTRQGQRVIHVETGRSSRACLPLFQWNPARVLDQQVVQAEGRFLLHAPGCQGGDKAIVSAAGGPRGEADVIVFGDIPFPVRGAALEMATPQSLVLLLAAQELEIAYAHIKGLHESHSLLECVLVGEGAQRLAQAAQRFLKMPFCIAKECEEMWYGHHAEPQTSSSTLTSCPALGGYVARILARRSQEADIITTYAS